MPRPYDCVRRAWHSERHQPIRGTLIQEIFRVVNEIHRSATKKNKEYQEKLPVVVLKAEEIMYSKANSEAEYMDLTTLLERTNDAIDIIIRRDEHTEDGQYLQPCIEAALSLGCFLRKASRSQRNNTPRCYLSRSIEEAPSVSHEYGRLVVSENVPSTSKKQCFELEHQPPSNLFAVYPLYCGNHIQFEESQQHGFRIPLNSVSNTFGTATTTDAVHNPLACDSNASSQRSQSLIVKGSPAESENPCTNKCDLSLRLGPNEDFTR